MDSVDVKHHVYYTVYLFDIFVRCVLVYLCLSTDVKITCVVLYTSTS